MSTPDRRLDKRQYNRRKQREFRQRLESKLMELRRTVYDLEQQVERRKPALLLPWADVATGLAAATDTSVEANNALHAAVQRTESILRALEAWAMHCIHPAGLAIADCRHRAFTATRMSLHADPDVRRRSSEWLMDRLYFNADALLAAQGLHRLSLGRVAAVVVDTSASGAAHYYVIGQRQIDAPIQDVAAALECMGRHSHGDFLLAGRRPLEPEWTRQDTQLVYSQATYVRNHAPWRDNRLYGVYFAPDRLVIASQNIHDDPLHPVTALQRHRYTLLVVDKTSETTCVARELTFSSQTFDAASYVSLEVEAAVLGAEPVSSQASDAEKHRAIRAHMTRRASAYQRCWERMLDKALTLVRNTRGVAP